MPQDVQKLQFSRLFRDPCSGNSSILHPMTSPKLHYFCSPLVESYSCMNWIHSQMKENVCIDLLPLELPIPDTPMFHTITQWTKWITAWLCQLMRFAIRTMRSLAVVLESQERYFWQHARHSYSLHNGYSRLHCPYKNMQHIVLAVATTALAVLAYSSLQKTAAEVVMKVAGVFRYQCHFHRHWATERKFRYMMWHE